MKNFLEWVKTLNKKILVGAIAGAIVVIVIIIAFVIGFGGDTESSNSSNVESSALAESSFTESDIEDSSIIDESSAQDNSEVSDISDIDESSYPDESSEADESSEPEENSEPEDISEPEEVSEPESEISEPEESSEPEDEISESEETSQPESEYSEPGETSKPEDESSEPENETSEPENDTSEPENGTQNDNMIGTGTARDPYLAFPDENMEVTTVSIPAGGSAFYGIYRVGGMILTISDIDAYVVCEGEFYVAESGKVSFEVIDALASDYVLFEIANNGTAAKSFVISFYNPVGSSSNPVSITDINKENKVSLPEGEDKGYFYEFVAEKAATIRFCMTATEDSVMLVTRVRDDIPSQLSTEEENLTNENGWKYIDLEVEAGDKISINVGVLANRRGKYPAVDITWYGEYIN